MPAWSITGKWSWATPSIAILPNPQTGIWNCKRGSKMPARIGKTGCKASSMPWQRYWIMTMNKSGHLLILPRLRVQNANAISAPLVWGFPAMTAFIGFMQVLERKLPNELYLQLEQVGV